MQHPDTPATQQYMEMAFQSPSGWGGAEHQHHTAYPTPSQPPPQHGYNAVHGLSPNTCTPDVYKQALREHAYELGIDPDAEPEYMWIAEESLIAPLTDGWTQIKQEDGEYAGSLYYFNENTGISQWEHPLDAHYRSVFQREKQKAAAGAPRQPLRAAWGGGGSSNSSGGSNTIGGNAASPGSGGDYDNNHGQEDKGSSPGVWGAGPCHSGGAGDGGSGAQNWGELEARHATAMEEQRKRLDRKLRAAHEEADAKGKAVAELRLELDEVKDERDRARRDLGLLHEQMNQREAAFAAEKRRKRDWREVVTDLTGMMRHSAANGDLEGKNKFPGAFTPRIGGRRLLDDDSVTSPLSPGTGRPPSPGGDPADERVQTLEQQLQPYELRLLKEAILALVRPEVDAAAEAERARAEAAAASRIDNVRGTMYSEEEMDELQAHLRAAHDSAAEWEQRHRDAEGALAEQRRARGNLERRLEDAETRLERSLRENVSRMDGTMESARGVALTAAAQHGIPIGGSSDLQEPPHSPDGSAAPPPDQQREQREVRRKERSEFDDCSSDEAQDGFDSGDDLRGAFSKQDQERSSPGRGGGGQHQGAMMQPSSSSASSSLLNKENAVEQMASALQTKLLEKSAKDEKALAELQIKLESAVDIESALRVEKAEAASALTKAEVRAVAAEEALAACERQLAALGGTKSVEQLAEARRKCADAERRTDEMAEQQAAAEHRAAAAEAAAGASAARIASVESAAADDKAGRAAAENALRAAMSRAEAAEAAARSAKDSLAVEGAAALHAAEGRAAAATERAGALARELSDAREQLAAAQEALDKAEASHASASQGSEAHRAEAERLRAKAVELSEAMEAATKEATAEARTRMSEAKMLEVELTEKAEAAASEATELRAALEKTKDKASALKGEKKKLETMTKELHAELKFALETGEALHKELDEKRNQLEDAREGEGTAAAAAADAAAKQAAAEAAAGGLEKDVAAARSAITSAEEARDLWMARFNEERGRSHRYPTSLQILAYTLTHAFHRPCMIW
jgi:hypothetical protein